MAKEEVLEAVKEEPKNTEETEEELSPLYYFFSTGCGFCKKAEPLVDSLIEKGYDILKLDMAEPDNQKLNKELSEEYGKQCGTPWFIDADSGNHICGFREADILEKWAKGEEIPEPPRLKGPMPKIPFNGASKEEENKWIKEYETWMEDNKHMGDDFFKDKQPKAILSNPRPNSDMPRPPMGRDIEQATEDSLRAYIEEYKTWTEENPQLTNVMKPEQFHAQLFQRMNAAKARMSGGTAQPVPPGIANVDATKINAMDARVQALEVKIDKIISHFGVK
tara:strand:+ start:812 stop:1645 length:834 start_codon:yes stop_codon:yes gene_type:complete